MKTVIILGAGWSGLPLAHKLLKYTAPKIELKIVLVSPNSHFMWNVAATRGIIPGEIPDDKLFLPIAAAFQHYSSEEFEFVLGAAQSIRTHDNTVEVKLNNGTTSELQYDQLVIATGSRLKSDLPLKPIGSHEATFAAWKALQTQVHNATSIIVGGAGSTGVEVAGELAAKYGSSKKVTLIVSGNHLLEGQSGLLDSVRDVLNKDLEKLGVVTIRNTRVTGSHNDGPGALTTVHLSNGSTASADLYLPLHGIKLNTSFIPSFFLDSRGNVKQEESMRVAGSRNIWALGDLCSFEPKQLTFTDNQIIHLSHALDEVLTRSSAKIEPYCPVGKTMVFISLGKKFATGQIGAWKLWGFVVAYVKGRKLFVNTAEGYVGGKRLRHASM